MEKGTSTQSSRSEELRDMNGLCPPSPGPEASGMLEGYWAMNGGGGSHLGPPSVRENQPKQGLQRLRLGLSRKEIL